MLSVIHRKNTRPIVARPYAFASVGCILLSMPLLTGCGAKPGSQNAASHVAEATDKRPASSSTPGPVEAESSVRSSESVSDDAPAVEHVSLDDETMIAVTKNTVRVVTATAAGSGVILGRDAAGRLYVLTASHATDDHIHRVELYAYDTTEYPAPYASLAQLEIVAANPRTDLAILRTIGPAGEIDAQGLRLAESMPSTALTSVYSAGCVDGQPPLIRREQILGRKKVTRGQHSAIMWKTKSAQQTGRSGGPLVNQGGEIIGVASGKHAGSGYYCHIEEISVYLVDTLGDSLVECETSGE